MSLSSWCVWKQPLRSFSTFPQTFSIFKNRYIKAKEKKVKLKLKGTLKAIDPNHEDDLPVYDFSSKKPMNRIYTWGNASMGALGVPTYLRPKSVNARRIETMFRPARCGFAETKNVVDIACGYGFTVFALNNKKYHIMGTGINTCGQLGYIAVRKGHPLEMLIQPLGITLPVRNPEESKVIKIAAGQAHTLALSNDGDVFSLGLNSQGQCGRPIIEDENYFENRVVHTVKGKWKDEDDAVIDIVCGLQHSFFLTKNGKIYACGWNADGQLGQGHFDSVAEPTLVKGDIANEKIIKIVSSTDSVLALSENGDIFGWGNNEYAQFATVTHEDQVGRATHLPLKSLGKIIDIASGGTQCLVLTDNYDVFTWGFGILGFGPDISAQPRPMQIPNTLFGKNKFNPDVHVTSIYSGIHMNAAINNHGELFTWGKNKGNCLGLGSFKDQYFPLKVALACTVSKVSLGVDHAAAICKPWT